MHTGRPGGDPRASWENRSELYTGQNEDSWGRTECLSLPLLTASLRSETLASIECDRYHIKKNKHKITTDKQNVSRAQI